METSALPGGNQPMKQGINDSHPYNSCFLPEDQIIQALEWPFGNFPDSHLDKCWSLRDCLKTTLINQYLTD